MNTPIERKWVCRRSIRMHWEMLRHTHTSGKGSVTRITAVMWGAKLTGAPNTPWNSHRPAGVKATRANMLVTTKAISSITRPPLAKDARSRPRESSHWLPLPAGPANKSTMLCPTEKAAKTMAASRNPDSVELMMLKTMP